MGIRIRSLTKNYRRHRVLNRFSLDVEDGIFGLLGNNGAGKSTLMKILATLLDYDEGDVEIFGYDLRKEPEEIRSLLGYLPQDFDFFSQLTLWETLDYLADLKGLEKGRRRKEEIEWQVDLLELVRKRIKELSGGMKRRLGIAQALLGDPKLLIVDEPTAGLDPNQRIAFRNLLNRISQGRVILLSTHIVPDISSTCEQVAIIRRGECLYQGYIDTLLESVEGKVWSVQTGMQHLDELSRQVHILSIVRKREGIQVTFLSDDEKAAVLQAEPVSPSLEDAFVYLDHYGKGAYHA